MNGSTEQPSRWANSSARAAVRLVTATVAPLARRARVARSDILPAPTTSTRRPSKPLHTWRASSTATELTETGWRAMAVSRRTLRAARKADWKAEPSTRPAVRAFMARS